MDDAIEALRRELVKRLTSRSDTAWTVTSLRFIVRHGGRVLCKVGRDDEHVLVEFPIPRAARDEVLAAPFVHIPPPGEGAPDRWRQARITASAEVDTLLTWLLPDVG